MSNTSNALEDQVTMEESIKPHVEDEQIIPCLGKEFCSEEEAYQLYNEYGRQAGFSIRRLLHSVSKRDKVMLNRKFVCSKAGGKVVDRDNEEAKHRCRNTRTKCLASLSIRLDRKREIWVVKGFTEEHNHRLHIPQVAHMMFSQRRLTAAQKFSASMAADFGLSLKASHDLMSAQVGGRENLGFTNEDLKWYLRTRRERDMEYGGLGGLMKYLQEKSGQDLSFYYAVQMDNTEHITNIFWADGHMISDCVHFGDVVSFDKTFRTNKESRPFGFFVGFNHFRKTVVLGAALMYDETIPSFEWVF